MIFAALVGFSLVTTVAVDRSTIAPPGAGLAHPRKPAQHESATLRRLIRAATDCVVRTVSADLRVEHSIERGDVNPLIVDAMTTCADDMRAMIDAHDRMYGAGSGEAYFIGPYLDFLPTTVNKRVQGVARQVPGAADR